MTEPIRILLADDHALLRQGLRALLETTPEIQVAGEAGDGAEAVEKAQRLQPDVILMDLMMPRMDGLTAIRALKQADPGTRILVLTSFDEDEKVFAAVKAGALGYLLKDSSAADLCQAIQAVHRGEPSLAPVLAAKVMREISRPPDLPPTESPLTEREMEVLDLVARGSSNQEIADKLVIAERTVGKHVSNILEKLHLANRTQAALYALRTGLARPGPGS